MDNLQGSSNELISRLFKERIIFLGREIDSDLANLIISQLLCLDAEDPNKDIYLYINSRGGSVMAGMAIYDTMQQIRPDVATVCTGWAAAMAAIILSAGTKGKRMSLPYSQMMISKPTAGPNKATDTEVQTQEILYWRQCLCEVLAQQTGQPFDRIYLDTEREFFMSADEAREYGLIDSVIDRKARTQETQPKPGDAVLGGQQQQPKPWDAVLGGHKQQSKS